MDAQLFSAAANGHLTDVQAALNQGASVHVLAGDPALGWTCLHAAAAAGHAEVVLELLCHGANPRARGKFQSTPLHHARGADVARALVGAGALVSAVDDLGNTPLHDACLRGDNSVVRMLCRLGADPAAVGHERQTPAHFAAFYGHLNAIRVLAEAGADFCISDARGMSAEDIAIEGGHVHVTAALLEVAPWGVSRRPSLVADLARKTDVEIEFGVEDLRPFEDDQASAYIL